MEITTLGRTGLKVSRLCLGTMNFGPRTEESDAHQIMDAGRPRRDPGGQLAGPPGRRRGSADPGPAPPAGEILGRFGQAFDAQVQQFPVPAFFDYAETRAALWRERSIISILSQQARADIALFSVGDVTSRGAMPGSGLSSHVYVGGYLEENDYATMKAQGVVGDVATIFVREDGSYDGVPLNERSSVPPPPVFRTIPRRLCVVAGANRARGLKGALACGLITDLVIDEQTAEALVALC